MALKANVVSGAREVKRAVDQLVKTVKTDGLKAPSVKKAESGLGRALAAERKLLRAVDSQFSDRKAEAVALHDADATVSAAEQRLLSLSAVERRQRMTELVPPGVQWPMLPVIFNLDQAVRELAKRANRSGHPQAYSFNDWPLVVRPGQKAQAAVAAFTRLQSRGSQFAAVNDRMASLGYAVQDKAERVDIALKQNRPARPLEQLMADLKRAHPTNPFAEGVRTLTHRDEIRELVMDQARQAPDLIPDKKPRAAIDQALRLFRDLADEGNHIVAGTERLWLAAADAAEKRYAGR